MEYDDLRRVRKHLTRDSYDSFIELSYLIKRNEVKEKENMQIIEPPADKEIPLEWL